MGPIDDAVFQIMDLASLLQPEDEEKFKRRTINVAQGENDAEVLRRLNEVMSQLRNILPPFETLEWHDFASTDEIDAVTIGGTVIRFDEYQMLGIPSGTHIVKKSGQQALDFFQIWFDGGLVVSVKRSNFPQYGIRIRPRAKSV